MQQNFIPRHIYFAKHTGRLFFYFLACITSFVLFLPAYGLDFDAPGDLTLRIDTNLSYGVRWRTESQDQDFATQGDFSNLLYRAQINKNDGDSNFETGLVSSVAKITSELDLSKDNFGLFTRISGFYDEVIMHGHHDGGRANQFENNGCGQNFCAETKDYAGSRAEFLDAYLWSDFELNNIPINVRLGNQVVQWGEALFLQDGINQVNPASLAALRLPGSEIKEALIPLPMFYFQAGLTATLTFEMFYQFDWDNSQGDPAGTFLSTHDAFIGEGSNAVLVDLAGSSVETLAQVYNAFARGIIDFTDPRGTQLDHNRATTETPKSDGQHGVAFRFFSESLNSTEFAVYYLNTHARKQVAGAILGDSFGTITDGSAACLGALQVIGNVLPAPTLACADMLGLATGGDLPSLGNATLASVIGATAAAGIQQIAQGMNVVNYLDTTEYFFIYPEELETFGFSFNTSFGETSVAGEIAYRPNTPFLTESGDNLIVRNAANAALLANGGSTSGQEFGPHLGTNLSAGDTLYIFDEKDMVNTSFVAIHNFGPSLGTDDLTLVGEIGTAYVSGLDSSILYAAEQAMSYIPGLPSDGAPSQYLDRYSWGYRLVVLSRFNNVYAGVNLLTSLKFAHDVEGNSVFGGNFIEGRRSATIGFNGTYNFNLEAGLSFTNFWGAEDRNQLQDRDHVNMSVKYYF